MTGWIVQSAFLTTEKFSWQAEAIAAAARPFGVSLEMRDNAGALFEWSGDGARLLSGERAPGFAIALDKDIPLLRALELCGARVFNSADAVELCDDKMKTHMRLSAAGIPMPRTISAPMTYRAVGYADFSFVDRVIGALGLPLVIKECYGSFGQQVYLANDPDDIVRLLKNAGGPALFQEYIAFSHGRDLRLYMVGDSCAAAMARSSSGGDFRANISQGGSAARHTPSPEELSLGRACMRALGLDFAGVDILFGRDGPLVCEVNSNAHFKSALSFTGVDISADIMAHVAREMGASR